MKSNTSLARRLYGDNQLMPALGEIRSRESVLDDLTYTPPLPPHDIASYPKEARLHLLQNVRDLHLPSEVVPSLWESIDLGVRLHYRRKAPGDPATWKEIGRCGGPSRRRAPQANTILLIGHSGSGKTEAVQRCLDLYPRQIALHDTFPGLVGPHYQMVWQSVSVPPSGKLTDLGRELMARWDDTLADYFGESHRRFTRTLARVKRDPMAIMHEWQQVARTHFLGALHLDEVQNLFKLPSIMQRRTQRMHGGKSKAPAELTVAEDMCLKHLLGMSNSGAQALILSGTHDGMNALERRFSNAQRFVSSGYHCMDLLDNVEGGPMDMFIGQLVPYQYVKRPLVHTPELRRCISRHTGGVRRLIIALWIFAHRVAFERGKDTLTLADFDRAAATYLAPVKAAVEALLSRDPARLRQYEDLLPKAGDPFWGTLDM